MKYLWLLSLFLIGCAQHAAYSPALSSVNLVDQNGMTQTIGSKERLKSFSEVDFQKPQPYQKVLRVYTPRSDGGIPAALTSYYPSGQIKQSLSILSGRACGPYKEWYENGIPRIEASLLGGSPQFGAAAEQTWIFDGPCKAYNDQGKAIGTMTYEKGSLAGEALYYSEAGALLKKIYYQKGLPEGAAEYYYPSGKLKQKIGFTKGLPHGEMTLFDETGLLVAEEYYQMGRLMEAKYPRAMGLAGVHVGMGFRLQERSEGYVLEEITLGELIGQVKEYKEGHLVHSYFQNRGVKDGKEYFWNKSGVAYIEIPYKAGQIQGEVITRYEGGELQSQREMSNNQKNGSLRAWYLDGQLMLTEEYTNDVLQSGSYYKKGSGLPISRVLEGNGTATLFDAQGLLEKKISYKDGQPS